MESVLARLEAATARLEKLSNQGVSKSLNEVATESTSTSASVAAFQEIVSGSLAEFLNDSAKLGSLVNEQANLVKAAFNHQLAIITTSSKSKKPADQKVLQDLTKPLSTTIQQIVELKDKNRPSKLFNHLAVVAESIGALGWVVVEPTPVPYVGELKESGQFWANKVIKEFKDSDKSQVEWANNYMNLLSELQSYVKKWHTTGLSWNPKGGDASTADVSKVPPTPTPTPVPAKPTVAGAGLLAGLSGAVSGLRKVDKSEMENHNNNPSVIVDKTEIRHVVYIYNCQNSTVQITGKVNAVTLDNCKKVGLVLENVVSTVDVVNCKSCKVQITGKAPTANIDKTDGLQLFLSREGLDVEIFTAKSSELNVVFEDPKVAPGSADYIEKPLSEQFKTKIVDGSLVTVPVEHTG
ncbi:F-actin-capping protein subunit alpha [Clydaea vesicula]|uniref:Adenylyl cyclase-associated protein n=1 Tax=Clydaea vesicula TaxID=447962 RepID=A0AAD5XXE0_9FUNG|nr:F-actin-capping protein subunit alpha [Clydaea vesicula]